MSEQNLETVPPAPESEPAPRWRSIHREPHSGLHPWAWARQAFFAPPHGLHVMMLVISMILGLAFVMRVKVQRPDPLEGLSERDLVTVLDELGMQEQNLHMRRGGLSGELDDLHNAVDETQAREQVARKAKAQAQITVGTVPAHDPSVTVPVIDAGANLTSMQSVMTLGELCNAGTEVIELNGIYSSIRSSFIGQVNSVAVDGIPTSPLYTQKVTGGLQMITAALGIQAGPVVQICVKGANMAVISSTDITIELIVIPCPPQLATYQ